MRLDDLELEVFVPKGVKLRIERVSGTVAGSQPTPPVSPVFRLLPHGLQVAHNGVPATLRYPKPAALNDASFFRADNDDSPFSRYPSTSNDSYVEAELEKFSDYYIGSWAPNEIEPLFEYGGNRYGWPPNVQDVDGATTFAGPHKGLQGVVGWRFFSDQNCILLGEYGVGQLDPYGGRNDSDPFGPPSFSYTNDPFGTRSLEEDHKRDLDIVELRWGYRLNQDLTDVYRDSKGGAQLAVVDLKTGDVITTLSGIQQPSSVPNVGESYSLEGPVNHQYCYFFNSSGPPKPTCVEWDGGNTCYLLGVREGPTERSYGDGKEVGQFKNGRASGQWTRYDSKGREVQSGNFTDGLPTGGAKTTTYRSDGKISSTLVETWGERRTSVCGERIALRHGEWTKTEWTYADTGKVKGTLIRTGTYKLGFEDLTWLTTYNGHPQEQLEYLAGLIKTGESCCGDKCEDVFKSWLKSKKEWDYNCNPGHVYEYTYGYDMDGKEIFSSVFEDGKPSESPPTCYQ